MASSIALRRATASSLLSKLIHPIRSASVARSFNTDTQVNTDAQVKVTNLKDDARSVDVDSHSRSPSVSPLRATAPITTFFPDVFDTFLPTTSVSQVLNLMDQMVDIPFLPRCMACGARGRGWDVEEDENALYLRLDMPGLDKDHVKVMVEQKTLIIKGEGEKESENEENVRKYSSRLDLPPNLFKVDEIKAEMKNGVLKIVVPKVKKEERKDVIEVKVE